MPNSPAVVALSLALVASLGLSCALLAGILYRLAGDPIPHAVAKGGTAFAGAVGLGVGLLVALGVLGG